MNPNRLRSRNGKAALWLAVSLFVLVALAIFYRSALLLGRQAPAGNGLVHSAANTTARNSSMLPEKFPRKTVPTFSQWPAASSSQGEKQDSSKPAAAVDLKLSGLDVDELAGFLDDAGSLKILTTKLPAAFVTEPYQFVLSAQGGMKPYRWEIVAGAFPDGMVLNSRDGVLYGTANESAAEAVQLRLIDSSNAWVEKEFAFLVKKRSAKNNFDQPLHLNGIELPQGMVGRRYYYGIPVEGGTAPYDWSIASGELPRGLKFLREEGIIYGAPFTAGVFDFSSEVTDANGEKRQASFRLTIESAPLYLTTSELPYGLVGRPYLGRLSAQGGLPPYRWELRSGRLPKGLYFQITSGNISGIPQEADQSILTLAVSDSGGGFDSAELRMMIQGGSLSLSGPKLPEGFLGKFYYAAFQASGGKLPYHFTLVGELPKGLRFDEESGTLFGIPKAVFADTLTVRVSDAAGESAESGFDLQIVEKALALRLPAVLSLSAGEFFFEPLIAEGGIPDYDWVLVEGRIPNGTVLLSNGIFFGTPTEAAREVIKVEANDQSRSSQAGRITIHVRDEPIALLNVPLPPARYKIPYSAALSALDGRLPYRWFLDSGVLPKGIRLDVERGVLSGTAVESSTFTFRVRVSDASGRSARAEMSLFVSYDPLDIVTKEIPNGWIKRSYQAALEVSGGTPPYSWQIVSGGLPQGLVLTQSGDIALLSGTPEEARETSFEVSVRDKANEEARRAFVIVVEGAVPKIRTESLKEAEQFLSYQMVLEVEGGTAPLEWSGTLPKFFYLDPRAGIISGTPESAGEFPVTLRVKDSISGEDKKSYVLKVTPKPLGFDTMELPIAHLGKKYQTSIKVSGGVPPYAWSIVHGRLPEALKLDPKTGVISGTPKERARDRSFAVRVTDSADTRVEKEFKITVAGEKPPPIEKLIAAPSDGKAGLAWWIPNDPSVREVRVFREWGNWPQTTNSFMIYAGSEDHIVDDGLMNGNEYFYIAVTADESGELSDVTEASKMRVTPRAVTLFGIPNPYGDHVVSFRPLKSKGFGQDFMPNNVLGPPGGGGDFAPQNSPTQLVSLHAKVNDDEGRSAPYGGYIVLEFRDNIIVNGEGVDFTIFENPFFVNGDFSNRFMEPAVVSVSQDGETFYTFPFDYVPHFDSAHREVTNNPFSYALGFAGIRPVYSSGGFPDPTHPAVSGGDSFDLSAVPDKKLKWVRFVKVQSTGDNWLVDAQGDRVRHTSDGQATIGGNKSGFDLDAVAAVHY